MSVDQPASPNTQEHQRLLTALRESVILRELAELLASSLDLDRILQVLVKRTTEVCEVERCAVWLLDDTKGLLRPVTYHLSSQQLNSNSIQAADHLWYHSTLPFEDPFIHRLLNENGMLFLEDLRTEPGVRSVAETFLVRSILLVALVREGRPVGMLTLDDPDKTRTFSSQQQQLARAIGQQAAVAIDNAQLYQQAQSEQRRAEKLIDRARAIYQVAMAVNSGEDLPAVLEIATHQLVGGLNADGGSIALLDNETLQLASSNKQREDMPGTQITAPLSDLPNCRHAAQAGIPLFVTAEQAEGEEITWFRKLDVNNAMLVPLMVGPTPGDRRESDSTTSSAASRCVGLAFVNYRSPGLRPSRGQFAFAQDIAAQCALAVDKSRLLDDANQAARLATERANTLDAIFHAMTEGITVTNQQGEVLILNNAASHFLGVPRNYTDQLKSLLQHYPTYTLLGQPISEEDFPLARALRGERIRAERFVTIRADGVERILEINIAPMLDSTRKQTGVVSAFRDITEQIRVEQRIRQALDTLLHVAEAVSGITDIKDILHSVLERTLVTLNCERGVVQIYDEELHRFTPLFSLGFSPESEQQWFIDQENWLHPIPDQYHGFQAQLMEGHATLINAEQCPHQPNPFSHLMILAAPIMHNDRLYGLISLDRSSYPRPDPAHQFEGQEHSSQNEFTLWDIAVTEGIAQLAGLALDQARWQQEAIDARTSEAAMREANTLKDEFLAITAHEFRTPLTVILAQSQLVSRILRRIADQAQEAGISKVPQLVDNLSVIEEQTHQLTNIVATFLEVTRLNRGELTLTCEEVDLAAIAQQVVIRQSSISTEHSITCLIEPGEHPYLVMGDGARLQQIIANLVDNAIKYSPLGGPINVCLHQYCTNEGKATIEVRVEDNGIGIPVDAQPRLFERFYRAPNIQGSKTRGIGLGLYIVAQLLKMQGGTIHVESSGIPGEGSRFIFTLPALQKA
ncbi:MAG TPA: GAF domain-containing protein [Ktedonobacteraceae bacterium]